MISFGQPKTVVKLLVGAFASVLVLLAIWPRSNTASPLASSRGSTPAPPRLLRRAITSIGDGAKHFGQAELQSSIEALCSRFDWEKYTIFEVAMMDNKLDCPASRVRAMTQVDCSVIVERHLNVWYTPGHDDPLLVKDHLRRFAEFQEKIALVEANVADRQIEDHLPRTRVSNNPLLNVALSDLPEDQRPIEGDNMIIRGDVQDLARSEVLEGMRSCRLRAPQPRPYVSQRGPWKVPASDRVHHATAGAPCLGLISTAAARLQGKQWDVGSVSSTLAEAWRWCSDSVAPQQLIDSMKTLVNARIGA
jgi:hypothetical protein